MRPHGLLLISLIFISIFPAGSFAGSPVHGSRAAGMGTAFAAVADDLSAILFNPAGLTQVQGTNFSSGTTIVIPSSEYRSPSGGSEKTEPQAFLAPQLYAASDFGSTNTWFGLGIYSPFGIGGRKWSESGLTREASTNTLIGTLAVNPVFAWRVTEWLSLGGGFYYQYASTRLEKMDNQSFVGADDAKSILEGNGGGWGYNLGILLFPGEKVSFGFNYRSHSVVDQKMNFSIDGIAPAIQPLLGGSSFKTGADSSIDFPQAVTFGIAWRPTGKLTFAIDVDWLGWSSLKTMNLHLHREVPRAGVSDTVIPFDLEDSWVPKVGVEYKLDDRIALRAGYMFNQTNVPGFALSPGNPDANQHGVSSGIGYKWGPFTFDTFYIADFFERRSVSNNILSGEYRSFTHIMGSSVSYKWK